MKRRIVLLGPPAAGKGTQAALIQERYGIPTISTGEALRQEMVVGSELGHRADRYTSKGQLFPDAIALELIDCWVEKTGDCFVFDGFPRTVRQADGLEELLTRRNVSLEVVVSLETREETIKRRVLNRMVCESCRRTVSVGRHVESRTACCPTCGAGLTKRSDDTLEALTKRMEEYREKTEPLIGYYRGKGILEPVCSEGSPEVVFERVSQILEIV